MQYHSFTRIWVCIVFLFHPFEAIFFSPRAMASFHCYHCQQLNFPSNLSISLSPTCVTHRLDCCYHRQFNPKPSYFHHLAGGRVAAVHEEASPNENAKRSTIHHQSLVPRVRLTRGSVSQMLQYIYSPPQNRSRSGGDKQILPLTWDAAALGRAPMPEWSPIVGRGLLCCLLNAYSVAQVQ